MTSEIASKLGELKKYAGLLRGYARRSRKELEEDLTLRGAVERYMQVAIEIVIETGEMIIAREGFRKPETNREVIEILGEQGILDRKFAAKFAPAAGFRNILEEKGVRPLLCEAPSGPTGKRGLTPFSSDLDELHSHLRHDTKDFDAFARQVAAYLRKKA